MSFLVRTLEAHFDRARVLQALKTSLEDLDWIVVEEEAEHISCKQKGRFDHFNPVEAIIKVSEINEGASISIEAKNLGIGTIQSEFLKGQVDKLAAMFLTHLHEPPPRKNAGTADCPDAQSIAREIESLSELHRRGELSDTEFKRAKEKLLGP